MPNIQLNLESSVTTAATATNITINKPTNTADTDFLLAVIHLEGDKAITPPAGWTLIVQVDMPSQANDTFVYYKRAATEGASWTWSHASDFRRGFVIRLKGVIETGDPEDCTRTTRGDTGGTTLTWDSITTKTAEAALICIEDHWDDSGNSYSSGTLTERIDSGCLFLMSAIQTVAWASGNKTAVAAQDDDWTTIFLGLKPEPGQGPKAPGTVANDAAYGTVAWANPTNAIANDGSLAVATPLVLGGDESQYLKATNFGFTIPDGARINGIVVKIEGYSNAGSTEVKDSRVRIVKADGTIGTTDKADTTNKWSTTPSVKTYGSSTDLWGETWTPAAINDADFGFVIAAQAVDISGTANIDYVEMHVYYTPFQASKPIMVSQAIHRSNSY